MPAAILLLEHLLAIAALLAIVLIIAIAIHERLRLNRLRKQFAVGQPVFFFVGHSRQSGRILKLERKRVKIRAFFDKCTYYSNYDSIEKL